MDRDESWADVEALLRRTPLRAPSPDLDRRLQRHFHKGQHTFRRLALAAAILLCIGLTILSAIHHQAAPIKTALQPQPQQVIQVQKVSSQIFDDGIVAIADNIPYQQLRRRTVHNVVLIDPQTQSRLELIVPTDQVIIAKAETY